MVHYWCEHQNTLFPLLQTRREVSKVVFTHARALPWCKKLYVISFSTHFGSRSHTFFYTVIHMLHLWQSIMFPLLLAKKRSKGLHVSMTPLGLPAPNPELWLTKLTGRNKCVVMTNKDDFCQSSVSSESPVVASPYCRSIHPFIFQHHLFCQTVWPIIEQHVGQMKFVYSLFEVCSCEHELNLKNESV